jgi:lysophospholipase L1-like esterase
MKLRKYLLFILLFSADAFAQSSSIVSDINGDGFVRILAFGDSVTYGVGDGTRPGQSVDTLPVTDGTLGYPARVENLFGVLVDNRGFPGEELAMGGSERFVRVVRGSTADIVILKEGANDAFRKLDRGTYSKLIQKMVNTAHVLGKEIVIATIPRSCCDHDGRQPFTDSFSDVIRELAFVNEIRFADIDRAWRTTCVNKEKCELYNLPDGLHPNTAGYDVIAQTIISSLLGIDIFVPGGSALLEGALGLPPGSVVVKPGAL